MAPAAPLAVAAPAPDDGGEVSTSFETADGLADGFPLGEAGASGVVEPGTDDPGLALEVGAGPERSYTAKEGVGFTGLHALHLTGERSGEDGARSEQVLMDVDVPVGESTRLSYMLAPGFDEQALDYSSTYVALDLLFTDGTRLSELGVLDQHDTLLTARGQGEAKTLSPWQWNHVAADLGAVAAGRTVDQVLLTLDAPAGSTAIDGWLDDVTIGDAPAEDRTRPSDWVVTTRGTMSNGDYSRGNNFPAAAVPNGFNFWTPVTDAGSLGTLYSYHDQNDAQNLPRIEAFSASHEPSIWVGDRQTFQVMPSVADGVPDADRDARALPFRHENETASPHHYGVTFEDGLRADVAPTDHAAVLRFAFPEGEGRHLVLDNVDDRSGLTISTDEDGRTTVQGWSETRTISAGMTRMYMYGTFDQPVTGSGMLADGNRPSTGYVSFDDDVVTMRMATSLIGVDQARTNLEQEVAPDDTLEDVAARAQDAWDERLGVVEVEGASDDELTTLYSNLYRVNLYPNSGYENTGTVDEPRYQHAVQASGSWTPPASSPTQTGARIADGKTFVNTGFWDTFRSAWPAYSLLAPDVAGELVDGFVQQYRDGGWVSPWSQPGYARVMTGTSSDSAFADAYVKGVPGIDAQDTYDAALKNATVRPPDSSVGRDGLARSPFTGYVANDETGGAAFAWSKDGALNDFAIGKMAQAMADDADTPKADRERLAEESEYFLSRSLGYSELYDADAGFFQGKSSTGEWTTPSDRYDPLVWGNDHDYAEADGWNEAFPAPSDGQGVAELYGGRAALADKLDEYFATPETALHPGSYGAPIHEMRETRDLRLGQWSIPNQVSHHIPWMYDYTQEPWKAQREVRAALDRGWIGSEVGQGYPGDEDNGATSAWWVFSALGFYPLQMATGDYALGSPLFEKTTLHLPGGDLVIEAPGTSDGNTYVQGLTVDGVEHTSTAISHEELADGGTLRFEMGPEPSDWGTGADDVPDSLTPVGTTPRQMHDVTGEDRGVASAQAPRGGTAPDLEPLFDDDSRTATTLTGYTPEVDYAVNGGDETEVVFYTLTSGDDADAAPSRWVLQGSDDGDHWRVLDRRSGEDFRWRGQTRPFKIAHPGSYEHYRVVFSGRGQQEISVAELELLTHDAIPSSPLDVDVADVSLRPGTTAPVGVTVTSTSEEVLSADVQIGVPAGWSVDPASVAVDDLSPGATTTTEVTVSAPADASIGAHPITATAVWEGWQVQGRGTAQVVGDATEAEPGSPAEADWLVADDGSALTGDGDGRARYADGTASFTYRLPIPADVASAAVTMDIANQFLVEASVDGGATWTTVLEEPTAALFQQNRALRTVDLAPLLADRDGAVLLRVSDSRPEDGWGAWLAGTRLETAG